MNHFESNKSIALLCPNTPGGIFFNCATNTGTNTGLGVVAGEALKCKCGGKCRCSGSTETCHGSNPGSSKGCYDRNDCRMLSSSPVSTGYCCSTDLCN
uniref:UPAR/Ly6 domain-containing protein n=1 Tax=Cynoglossus semilaevis TaxID=244447 RepID=A0A3P8VBW0_CYNSE